MPPADNISHVYATLWFYLYVLDFKTTITATAVHRVDHASGVDICGAVDPVKLSCPLNVACCGILPYRAVYFLVHRNADLVDVVMQRCLVPGHIATDPKYGRDAQTT